MQAIHETDEFSRWLSALADAQARTRIQARINRLAHENPGQHRMLAGGLTELKIDYGPGYRVYYTMIGKRLLLLLCGGDKRTQAQDIKSARAMAKSLRSSQ